MKVSDDYYKDGVVGGFYVSSWMKRAWAAQIEVLEDVAEVCENHNIRYFADAGTLIGTIRHGGFIPWDDDLDIVMMREDYEEFLKYADELPDNYRILNWRNDDEWENTFTRVVNSDRLNMDDAFMGKYHGFPFVVGIDIFVNDYLYRDEKKEIEREELLKAAVELANAYRDKTASKKEIRKEVGRLEALSGYHLNKKNGIVKGLFEIAENLMREVKREDADEAVLMPAWIEFRSNRYDIGWYDDAVPMKFESTKIMVPVHYNEILRNKYGDYLRASRIGGMHDYPFYSKQMDILNEKTGWEPPVYKCDSGEINLGDNIRNAKKKQQEMLQQQVIQIESLMQMQGNSAIFAELAPQVDSLKQSMVQMQTQGDEVVFLPYSPKYWGRFEALWVKEKSDYNNEVVVLPLPVYDMNLDGSTGELHYDLDAYPDYLNPVSVEEYDLGSRHPKRIYFQVPYDGYNPAASVHPAFYSEELLKYTDELIYVPYFPISDIVDGDEKGKYTLDLFVKMPGTIHADRILVSEEYMKRIYVDALVSLVGEDTREVWENRVEVVENLFTEDERKRGEKSIFYYTDVCTFLTKGDAAVDKLDRNIGIFKESKEDVKLVWHPAPKTEETLSEKLPEIYKKYKEIVDKFVSEGWGIFDNNNDGEETMNQCSAYYGDPSQYVYQAQMEKKPVMIASVDV